MDKDICKNVEKILMSIYGEIYDIVNYGHYLWVFKNSTDKMIMVIHGGEYKPFEIKLIKIDENRTIDKQFESESDFYKYLSEDLVNDLMVYGI